MNIEPSIKPVGGRGPSKKNAPPPFKKKPPQPPAPSLEAVISSLEVGERRVEREKKAAQAKIGKEAVESFDALIQQDVQAYREAYRVDLMEQLDESALDLADVNLIGPERMVRLLKLQEALGQGWAQKENQAILKEGVNKIKMIQYDGVSTFVKGRKGETVFDQKADVVQFDPQTGKFAVAPSKLTEAEKYFVILRSYPQFRQLLHQSVADQVNQTLNLSGDKALKPEELERFDRDPLKTHEPPAGVTLEQGYRIGISPRNLAVRERAASRDDMLFGTNVVPYTHFRVSELGDDAYSIQEAVPSVDKDYPARELYGALDEKVKNGEAVDEIGALSTAHPKDWKNILGKDEQLARMLEDKPDFQLPKPKIDVMDIIKDGLDYCDEEPVESLVNVALLDDVPLESSDRHDAGVIYDTIARKFWAIDNGNSHSLAKPGTKIEMPYKDVEGNDQLHVDREMLISRPLVVMMRQGEKLRLSSRMWKKVREIFEKFKDPLSEETRIKKQELFILFGDKRIVDAKFNNMLERLEDWATNGRPTKPQANVHYLDF